MAITFSLHPYYQLYYPQWLLSRDLYIGDPLTMRSEMYLTRYALENNSKQGQAAYNQRASRTYYTNYKKAIEQLWLTYIFMKDPDLSKVIGDSSLFTEEEARNIDGNGKSLLDFIKDITATSIRYGWCYIHVDSPPLEEGASKQASLEKGIRPWAWIWNPLDVPDWQDVVVPGPNYGKMQILHHQFLRPAARKSLAEKPQIETIREEHSFIDGQYLRTTYRRRQKDTAANTRIVQDFRTQQYLVDNGDQWEQIGEPQTAPWMQQMPVIRSIQEAWTFDVDQKVLQLYQQESSLDNILYYQAYTRIAIAGTPADKNPQGAPAAEDTILWLEPNSSVFPIPSESATAMSARCAETKNAIFRLGLYQLRQLNAISNAAQAADTQREEKANTYAHAKCKIQEIEDTIYQFFQLWAAYKNKEFDPEMFSLRKTLTHEDLEEFLTVNEATLTAQDELPALKAEMRKKMLSFLELDDQAKRKIEQEIDAAPQQPSQQGQTGKPGLQRDQFLNGYQQS